MPNNLQMNLNQLGRGLESFYASKKYQRRIANLGLQSDADVKEYLGSDEGKDKLATIAVLARLEAIRNEQMAETIRLEEQGDLFYAARGLIDSRDDYLDRLYEAEMQQSASRRAQKPLAQQKDQLTEYLELIEEYEKELKAVGAQIEVVKKELILIDQQFLVSEEHLQHMNERHTEMLTHMTEAINEVKALNLEERQTEGETPLQELQDRTQAKINEVSARLSEAQTPEDRRHLENRMAGLQLQLQYQAEVRAVVRDERNYFDKDMQSVSVSNSQNALLCVPKGQEKCLINRNGVWHYFDNPEKIDYNDPASWTRAQENFNNRQLFTTQVQLKHQVKTEIYEGERAKETLKESRMEHETALTQLTEAQEKLENKLHKVKDLVGALEQGLNQSAPDTAPTPKPPF